jgi:hypothetical protein
MHSVLICVYVGEGYPFYCYHKILFSFPVVEVRADAICSAAARRPLFIGGGGGARFSAARRRRGVLRLLTQFHTFCSVYFYSFTSISLPFTYYLTGKHRCNLWVVQWGPVSTPFQITYLYYKSSTFWLL